MRRSGTREKSVLIELEEEFIENSPDVLVAGIGNAGCAIAGGLFDWRDEVNVLAVDTDAAVLKNARAHAKIQIGARVSRGAGTALNPQAAEEAVLEDRKRMEGILRGREIVFITAGLGGGAGSGACPVLADIASEGGASVVGVVTVPFEFEGEKKADNASRALKSLSGKVDCLVVIPNDDIFPAADSDASLAEAAERAGSLITGAVKNICELAINPSIFKIDLPTLRRMLSGSGTACFGSGSAEGPDRCMKAIDAALNSPLVRGADIRGADGVFVHVRGGRDITQNEIRKIYGRMSAGGRKKVIVGVSSGRKTDRKMGIWLLLTGVGADTSSFSGWSADKDSRAEVYDIRKRFAGFEDELEIPAIFRRRRER